MSLKPGDLNTKRPIVVKIGGSILGDTDTTLQDLVKLQQSGIPTVVVHGGGLIISQWMAQQGIEPTFVNGLRVTDAASMAIVTAVLCGLVNKHLVSSIQSLGGKAWGMSGVDGSMIEANILDEDLGYVGNIVKVNPDPIYQALDSNYIPIIAPVAINPLESIPVELNLLNLNGDTAAGEIAKAIYAESIIFLTDVEGIKDSNGILIDHLTIPLGESLIEDGTIAGGMIPKFQASKLAMGRTDRAQISDGRKQRALIDFIDGIPSGTRIG